MTPRWLFRMARWAQNPPSARQVKFVLSIVAVCLALFASEYFLGWPEALTPENMRGLRP